MPALARNHNRKHAELLVVAGVLPANPSHNNSCNHCKLTTSHLIKVVATPLWGVMTAPYTSVRRTAHSAVATAPGIYEIAFGHWKNCYTSKICGLSYRNARKRTNIGLCLPIIVGVFCLVLVAFAQDPAPTPQTTG